MSVRRAIGRLFLAGALLAVAASAQQLTALYQQLLRPAIAQSAAVENTAFAWDGLHFTLADGRLFLAAPVEGHVTAAVFLGHGRLAVDPPDAIERRQMQLFRKQDALDASFTEAVFRFGDDAPFLAALGDAARFSPLADARSGDPAAGLLRGRANNMEQLGRVGVARVLVSMGAGAPDRLLIAELHLDDGAWIEADFDPLEQEPLRVHAFASNTLAGNAVFDDIWTQFAPSGAITPAPFHLDAYDLAVTIPDNLEVRVQAGFTLHANAALGDAVLLTLLSNMRVTAATLADGTPLGWLQPKDPGSDPAPGWTGDWLVLRLPHPLAAGDSATVKLTYDGKYVVEQVGTGNFFCRDFGWYPLDPFGPPMQRASFHMQFTVNHKYTAVVTGVRDSQSGSGDRAVSDWSTPVPLTVAGFALGEYSELDGDAAVAPGHSLRVQVFSNRVPDDAMSYLNFVGTQPDSPAIGTLDTTRLAPQVLEDVTNALRYMSAYFGPLPYATLAVTDIPGDYGQGWPTLLYLASISYLDGTQLDALGIHGAAMHELSFSFRAHETSHQWWGHEVSWATPGDQWLSEGFANASAFLYESARYGLDAGLADLKQWQRDLTEKDTYGHVPDQLGPLVLGNRLSSSVDPEGYDTVIYDKGAYVLLMVRSMLQGGGKDPDAAFIGLMHDFTSTYAQRDASTADFKAMVEKHMTPEMDLDGNHRMDWFFNEYVYGTGVPTLTFTYSLAPGPQGGAALHMHVDNPQGWKGLLPVYIYRDGSHAVRGQIGVTKTAQDAAINLPFRPVKVVANANLDMLLKVDQTNFR